MKHFFEFIKDRTIHCLLFGTIYFLLESAWKGYWTNWRMFVLAGFIGLLIGSINELFTYETDLRLQCLVGMMISLLCECIFGYQWNIIEGLGLWNYSNPPLSYFSAVAGQINFFFALAWIVLSLVCIILDDLLSYYFCKDTDIPPYYTIGGEIIYTFPVRC